MSERTPEGHSKETLRRRRLESPYKTTPFLLSPHLQPEQIKSIRELLRAPKPVRLVRGWGVSGTQDSAMDVEEPDYGNDLGDFIPFQIKITEVK